MDSKDYNHFRFSHWSRKSIERRGYEKYHSSAHTIRETAIDLQMMSTHLHCIYILSITQKYRYRIHLIVQFVRNYEKKNLSTYIHIYTNCSHSIWRERERENNATSTIVRFQHSEINQFYVQRANSKCVCTFKWLWTQDSRIEWVLVVRPYLFFLNNI